MKSLSLLAALCLLVPVGYAQERTASGNFASEASWTALQSLVQGANANAKAAHIRLNQMEVCGTKGMLYAPSATGVDTQGCKAIGGAQVESGTVNTPVRWANQSVKVTFSKPFKTVPTVTVGLRSVQYQDKCREDYLRFEVAATQITTTGFTMTLTGYLWGCQQTNISSAVWMAHD